MLKKISLLLCLGFILLGLVACNSSTTQEEALNEEKVVETIMGEIMIPQNPEKIMVLHPYFNDHLLALGIKPYASVSAGPKNANFPGFLEDKMDGVENIGWQLEPNIEQILAKTPDLIISKDHHEKQYENLSKVAVTVLDQYAIHKDGSRDWKTSFMNTAKVFGKDEEAEKIISDFNKKAEEAKETIKNKLGNKNAMVLRVTAKDIRYYTDHIMTTLYSDLGVGKPKYIPGSDVSHEPIAIEKLIDIDPDYIFVIVDDEKAYEDLQKSPIWNALNATKNKNVVKVDYDVWFQGFGPISNSMIIDDVLEFLIR